MKYLIAIAILGFIAWRVAVSENLMWELIGVPLSIIGVFLAMIVFAFVMLSVMDWVFETKHRRLAALVSTLVAIAIFGGLVLLFSTKVAVPAFAGNFLPLMFIVAGGFFFWASALQKILQRVKSHNARLVIVMRRVCELERNRNKDISYQACLLSERLRVEVERKTILHHDLIHKRTDGDHSEGKLARHGKMGTALIEIEEKAATLWGMAQRSNESLETTEPGNVPEYVKRAERTARTAIELMTRESRPTSALKRWLERSIPNDARHLVDRLESEREMMLKKGKVTEAFKKIEEEVTALASKAQELNEGNTE